MAAIFRFHAAEEIDFDVALQQFLDPRGQQFALDEDGGGRFWISVSDGTSRAR